MFLNLCNGVLVRLSSSVLPHLIKKNDRIAASSINRVMLMPAILFTDIDFIMIILTDKQNFNFFSNYSGILDMQEAFDFAQAGLNSYSERLPAAGRESKRDSN